MTLKIMHRQPVRSAIQATARLFILFSKFFIRVVDDKLLKLSAAPI